MDKLTRFLPKVKLSNSVVAFLSSAFQAFGLYNVHALTGITEGGIFGATLLVDHWLHISPSVTSFLLNGACYILGWRTLGKSFIAYSLLASCGFSAGYAVCEQFPPLWPGLVGQPLLSSLLGAVFIGVGAGLCVRAGGATSGDDALAMSLVSLSRGRLKIQWIYLASDITVLLLSLSYIPLRRISYSLLTVILSGQIIGIVQTMPLRQKKQNKKEPH